MTESVSRQCPATGSPMQINIGLQHLPCEICRQLSHYPSFLRTLVLPPAFARAIYSLEGIGALRSRFRFRKRHGGVNFFLNCTFELLHALRRQEPPRPHEFFKQK